MSHNPTYQTPHNDGYMFQAVLRLSDVVWPWTTYIPDQAGPGGRGGAPGANTHWRHSGLVLFCSAGITGDLILTHLEHFYTFGTFQYKYFQSYSLVSSYILPVTLMSHLESQQVCLAAAALQF